MTTAGLTPAAVGAHLAELGDPARVDQFIRQARMLAARDVPDEKLGLLGRAEKLGKLLRDGIPPVSFLPGIGDGLVYDSGLVQFSGHPESGKTTFVCRVALDAMRAGRPVIYLDYENGRTRAARRFEALGAGPELLDEKLVYVPFPGAPNFLEFEHVVQELPGAVFIIDSVRGALGSMGLKENDADDTKALYGPLEELSRTHDVPVLLIDHVTKGADESERYARGSGDKAAALDAAFFVRAVDPFSKTQAGTLRLTKQKDRDGDLPRQMMFSVGDGQGGLPIEPVEISVYGDVGARIVEFLQAQEAPVSARAVCEGVRGDDKKIRERVKAMASAADSGVAATDERNPRYFTALDLEAEQRETAARFAAERGS